MDGVLVSKEEFVTKVEELITNGDGPFSIAVADVDNFESINKIYGYAIGDEVIKKVIISIYSEYRYSRPYLKTWRWIQYTTC